MRKPKKLSQRQKAIAKIAKAYGSRIPAEPAKPKRSGAGLPSTVPDAAETEDGVCLVPITRERLAALAGGGQDVSGLSENTDK